MKKQLEEVGDEKKKFDDSLVAPHPPRSLIESLSVHISHRNHGHP